MKTKSKKTRVCYVVCYRDPDYTRTNSLINAIKKIDGVELTVIKNRHKGIVRYLEVPPRLLWARLRLRPDVFVVGFRAHEIFWAFYPAMAGKKIIFDEFIDAHDWLVNEHKKLIFRLVTPLIKIVDGYMKLVMALSHKVLTDTKAHAALAVKNYGVSPDKVVPIYIGADEDLFYPRQAKKHGGFKVLFYGSMLPLHGLDYILGAMQELAERGKAKDVQLTLVGGRGNQALADKLDKVVRESKLAKANIVGIPWVDSDKLPQYIAEFDLALGGPFGDTGQGRRVITGKTYQLLRSAKATVVGRIEETEGFDDKRNCLLVEQGSATEIADAIQWASEHRDELEQIGAAGRKLYDKSFSSEVISRELAKIIL